MSSKFQTLPHGPLTSFHLSWLREERKDSKMIKPTIGRRVWYWPSQADFDSGADSHDPSQPFDAGVVCVNGDRSVNLTITDHEGITWFQEGVQLVQPEDTQPSTTDGGFAVWMDYQIQQAAPQS